MSNICRRNDPKQRLIFCRRERSYKRKRLAVYGCSCPASLSGSVEDQPVSMQTGQIPSEILQCAVTKAMWWLCGALGSTNAASMTTMMVLTDIVIAGTDNVGILLRSFV